MVSSYLICDVCGQFGPPAGFLHENGLRLCYQCWYRERLANLPPATGDASKADADPVYDPEQPDRKGEA